MFPGPRFRTLHLFDVFQVMPTSWFTVTNSVSLLSPTSLPDTGVVFHGTYEIKKWDSLTPLYLLQNVFSESNLLPFTHSYRPPLPCSSDNTDKVSCSSLHYYRVWFHHSFLPFIHTCTQKLHNSNVCMFYNKMKFLYSLQISLVNQNRKASSKWILKKSNLKEISRL